MTVNDDGDRGTERKDEGTERIEEGTERLEEGTERTEKACRECKREDMKRNNENREKMERIDQKG